VTYTRERLIREYIRYVLTVSPQQIRTPVENQDMFVMPVDQNTSLSPLKLADLNQSSGGKIVNTTKLVNRYILLETKFPAQSKSLLESLKQHAGEISPPR